MAQIMTFICAALAITLSSSSAQANGETSTCLTKNAVYRLNSTVKSTARFIAVPKTAGMVSDVAFSFDGIDEVNWFIFDEGARDYVNLISTTDVTTPGWSPPVGEAGPRPHGELQFIGIDSAGHVLDHAPKLHSAAPAIIIIPQLGLVHKIGMSASKALPLQEYKLLQCVHNHS